MATRTISALGGKASETTAWKEAAVPTASDDIVAEVLSGNLEVTAELKCRSIDLTNYTGTFKITESISLKIGTSTAGPGNVALNFPTSGWTFEITGGKEPTFSFNSTSGTTQTIETGGKSIGKSSFEGAGSSYQLSSSLTSAFSLGHTKGTLDFNGKAVSVLAYTCTGTNARKLKTGASAISLTGIGTGIALWEVSGENATIEASEATITTTYTNTSGKKFIGGANTYGSLIVTGGGTGALTIGEANSNTFSKIEIKKPKVIKFGKEKTQTVAEFIAIGAAGELITIESTEAGKAWILKKTSGTVSSDYLKLKDSHTEGGAKFYAGTHSENISGNEGWIFEAPAAPAVESKAASAVKQTEATLAGTINPKNQATTYKFEYGKTEALGTSTEAKSAGEGTEAVEKTEVIESLEANTKYFFRVSATNATGTSQGLILNFTTESGAIGPPLGSLSLLGVGR